MASPPSGEERREVEMCRVDDIWVPDTRVTSVVDDETFEELKRSIAVKGILQPILVARTDGKLVLIDGLHRLRAARELGMDRVPCIVKDMTVQDVLIENLITARQRGTSNPADEAIVIRTLIERYGYSYDAVAKIVGMSKDTVKKYYRIAQLPQEVLDALKFRRIGVQCAYYMTYLMPDREKVLQVLEWAVKFGYTAEQCQAAVMQLLRPSPPAQQESPAAPGWRIDTETGKPERVYPRCPVCGNEIRDEATYIWLHPDCARLVLEALEMVRSYGSEAQRESTGGGSGEAGEERESTGLGVEKRRGMEKGSGEQRERTAEERRAGHRKRWWE